MRRRREIYEQGQLFGCMGYTIERRRLSRESGCLGREGETVLRECGQAQGIADFPFRWPGRQFHISLDNNFCKMYTAITVSAVINDYAHVMGVGAGSGNRFYSIESSTLNWSRGQDFHAE
jgi:hypothetical protein